MPNVFSSKKLINFRGTIMKVESYVCKATLSVIFFWKKLRILSVFIKKMLLFIEESE